MKGPQMIKPNLYATSFYWNLNVVSRINSSKDSESKNMKQILKQNRLLISELHEVSNDVDLTQRQKAVKMSKIISNFTDNLEVFMAILNTQTYLEKILSEETPLEFKINDVTYYFGICHLTDSDRILTVKDYDSFIPLNQYTDVKTIIDFLNRNLEFEDLTDAYENLKFEQKINPDDDIYIDIQAINGWRPYDTVKANPLWYSDLEDAFISKYTHEEKVNLLKEYLKENSELKKYFSSIDDDTTSEDFDEEYLNDQIEIFPETLSYYKMLDWYKFLALNVNKSESSTKFIMDTWTGYSQGEGGVILYKVENSFENQMFMRMIPTRNEYYAAIARGDTYYKHVYKSDN